MKKNLSKLALLFMVLFVTAGVISCEMFKDEDSLAIIGEWDTSYTSSTGVNKVVFTESVYESYSSSTLSYSAEIVSYNNDSWNMEETGEGSYGYMVIQFVNPPSWNTSIQDKFMVLRWQNFADGDSAVMEYSEGTDYPTNTYFDTADDAKEGATTAAGFFNAFTEVPEL